MKNYSKTLTERAIKMLGQQGFTETGVTVVWNKRLQSCAGKARYRLMQIDLNPALAEHKGEIKRTFLHELAHILNYLRCKQVGLTRCDGHGPNWKKACCDLGIPNEKRCHSLNLSSQKKAKYMLTCNACGYTIPRQRKPKHSTSCGKCCKTYNSKFLLTLSENK